MTAEENVSQEAVVKRLRRIEGQVRGIQNMVESGRDCESVLVQIAAVRSAVEGVGALVLNNYMKLCFRSSDQADSEALSSLARAIAVWGRIHIGDGDR